MHLSDVNRWKVTTPILSLILLTDSRRYDHITRCKSLYSQLTRHMAITHANLLRLDFQLVIRNIAGYTGFSSLDDCCQWWREGQTYVLPPRQSDQFCNQGIFQDFGNVGVNQPLGSPSLPFPLIPFSPLDSPSPNPSSQKWVP